VRQVLEALILPEDRINPTKLDDWTSRITAKYAEAERLDWPKHESAKSAIRVELKRLLSALGFPRDRRDSAVDNVVAYFEQEYIARIESNQSQGNP
jgi:Domain of unknown function (DUF3387)